MKIFTIVSAMFLSLVLATTTYASGVLIDAKGTVEVTKPGGKAQKAAIGIELPDGSIVSTGKNASASVMFMDGSIEDIAAKQKYTVGSNKKDKKSKTMIEGLALAMNEASAGGSSPTVHGMVKMTQLGPNAPQSEPLSLGHVFGPTAIYPSGTTIEIPDEITFKWAMNGKFGFSNPVMVVEDSAGKQLFVKNLSADTTQVAVKSGKLKLKDGQKYSWYIASRENRKLLGKSRRFNFATLSATEKKKLDQDCKTISGMGLSQDSKQFLTAQLYYRANMISDMVNTLLPIWNKEQSDGVKKLLYLGYVRMGQPDEAMKYK